MSTTGTLLLGHATGTRHWDIFKGLQDAGESPRETALRELREECGLEPDPSALLELGRFHYLPLKDLYLFAMMIEPIATSDLQCTSTFADRFDRIRAEVDDYRWVAFTKIAQRCGKSMARVLTVDVSLTHLEACLRAQRT